MKDDIISMAREAGGKITAFINYDYGEDVAVFYMADLHRFAALVASDEREACAALVDGNAMGCDNPIYRSLLQANAAAIRAMEKT